MDGRMGGRWADGWTACKIEEDGRTGRRADEQTSGWADKSERGVDRAD